MRGASTHISAAIARRASTLAHRRCCVTAAPGSERREYRSGLLACACVGLRCLIKRISCVRPGTSWRRFRSKDRPFTRVGDHAASAKRSRKAVFLNLPVAVRGIASMNSMRSGSCHLANWLPRCARSSSGLPAYRRVGPQQPMAAHPTSRRARRSPPPPRLRCEPSIRSRGRPRRSTRHRT